MCIRRRLVGASLAALVILAGMAAAAASRSAAVEFGALLISDPWSRPTPPASVTGVAYLTITNRGAAGDRLVGMSTPVAHDVQIHETRQEHGLVTMRELQFVDCAPHDTVRFAPDGVHLMLIGLDRPLSAGTHYPLTLRFEHGGLVTIEVLVR